MELTDGFVKKMIESFIPIHKFLGLELLEIKQDYAKVKVPFRPEVVGDIRTQRWHGGIITTIMDSVGGIVGMTHLTSLEDKMSTIDIRVDFLRPAHAEAIIVEGETQRLGSRILVTKMRAFLESDPDKTLLAEGKAVYNYLRMKK